MESNDPFQGMDDAPAFKVVEAQREAVPALICLWGMSDGGKTYSALRLARGLVGPRGKIVVIDTENRRAKFYAGLFGGWSHIDMQPPFTPQRYTAALSAAIGAGANVVIVDSMSHVWQGQGGVLDQADASTAKGLAKWKNPKMAYMRMMNGMLRAPVHVIFCVRAKEKFVQKGAGKDAEIVSAGLVPITDSRFIYEQTVAAYMEGHRPCGAVKIPGEIAHAIKAGEYITEESGRLIAEWLAGGSPVDHTATALQASARDVATQGSIKFRDWWQSITKTQRATLRPVIPELKEIADQADEEAARAASQASETANDGDDPLADPFTDSSKAAA
jgi:hypothetical protein